MNSFHAELIRARAALKSGLFDRDPVIGAATAPSETAMTSWGPNNKR